jgi:Protein of unknown function (DUF2628)
MKTFAIYTPSTPSIGIKELDAVRVVKEGFSWPAFFFGPLWALYHRHWLAALALAAVSVAFLILPPMLSWAPFTELSLQLLWGAFLGVHASQILEKAYTSRGLALARLIPAHDRDEALHRFFREETRS